VRVLHEISDHLLIDLGVVAKEGFIAYCAQLLLLLLDAEPRHVIDSFCLNTQHVPASPLGHRRLNEIRSPIGSSFPRHQPVDSKRLLIEKNAASHVARLVELLIEILVEAVGLDAKLLQQPLGFGAVARRSFNGLGPSVAEQQAITGAELVALRVPAEIVVILQDQNARVVAGILPIEERSRQTADARSDDDQIVGFVFLPGVVPGLAVAGRVGDFE